jgi:heat shock protein HtpX
MLGFASQLAWNSIRYARFSSSNSKNKAGMLLVLLITAFILWIGYLATIVTRFALSRRREYMADAGAIELTKNPEAMMRALKRIAQKEQIPQSSENIALMCIENRKRFLGLFATHPPIEDRISAISQYTGTKIPDIDYGTRASDQRRFLNPEQDQHPPWLSRVRRSKNPWIVTDADM